MPQKTKNRTRNVRQRAVCEALEARTLLNGGVLDTSFDHDGYASIIPGTNITMTSYDAAVQSDGKVVVVGSSVDSTNGANHSPKFTIARFNIDGSIDKSFGPNGTGVAYTTFYGNDGSVASAVAIQPDGSIVVVGKDIDSLDPSFAVARYLSTGFLDTSFGDYHTGFYSTNDFGDFVSYSYASDVVIQNDGKIVIVGSVYKGEIIGENTDMAVLRLNTDGSLDTGFGDNGDAGSNAIGFGDYDNARAVTIDYSGTAQTNPNYGKIIIVGGSGPTEGSSEQFAVCRLNTDGNLDDSFSGDGEVLSPFVSEYKYSQATGVTVQSTGKIVVSGTVGPTQSSSHNFGVFRLNANGSGDSSFGVSNGQIEINFGTSATANSLIVGQTGKLILGGGTSSGQLALAILNGEGTLDTYAAGGGMEKVSLGYIASGLALGPAGTFVATGGSNFGTERFFDRAPTVYIASTDFSAAESGQDPANFIVFRTEILPYATKVFFSVGGTASAPGAIPPTSVDYTGISNSVALRYVFIPAFSDESAPVVITPVDDTRPEFDETVIITLSANPGFVDVISTAASQVLTIADNDRQVDGTLFNDANSNGIFDAGDSVLSGWTVYVDTNNNKVLDTGEQSFITNTNGQYLFGNLPLGTNIVREVLKGGYRITYPIPPADSNTVNVIAGKIVGGVNFANTTHPLISGYLFDDESGNGVKDGTEKYLQGWQVYVDLNKNGSWQAGEPILTTGANGAYVFNTIAPGTYRIAQILQSGYIATSPVPNNYFDITVASGQTSASHNFADRLHSISGLVFNDLDKDGVKDTNESGFANVIVWIDTNGNGVFDEFTSSSNGTVTLADAWAFSNASGNYSIYYLNGGTYLVRQILPTGYSQSLPTGGAGRTVTLSPTLESTGNNFGLYKTTIAQTTTSITGSVFNDLNLNGNRDIEHPTDPDVANRTVWLDLDNDGVKDSNEPYKVTDASGNFTFANLTAGITYYVRDIVPTGWYNVKPSAGVITVKLAVNQQAVIHFATALIDPDDTIAEVANLASNTRTLGQFADLSLETQDDVDLIKFTVQAGQKVGFDVDSRNGSNIDTYLRLFNSSGTALASNNDGTAPGETASQFSYLEYTFATAGTYYIGVSKGSNRGYNPITGTGDVYGDGAVGAYRITLNGLGITSAVAATHLNLGASPSYPKELFAITGMILDPTLAQ